MCHCCCLVLVRRLAADTRRLILSGYAGERAVERGSATESLPETCAGMNVSKRIAAMLQQHEVKVEVAAAGGRCRRRWLGDMPNWDADDMAIRSEGEN